MDKKMLDKLVDETINSMDTAARATAAPYLMTRIQAKMNKETGYLSAWEKISTLLGKPVVAFPSLVLVLLLNFWIIRSSVSDNYSSSAADFSKVSSDDYSLSTATSLFDFENGQR